MVYSKSLETQETSLETQETELPAIIQNIIQAKADNLKALLEDRPDRIVEIVRLIATETRKAKENPDSYLIKYLHDKLGNGEDLTEEEFNILFEKEEREEILSDEYRAKLLEVRNLFIQVNKGGLQEYNFLGGNLSGVNLYGADLRNANFDENTIFPLSYLIVRNSSGKQILVGPGLILEGVDLIGADLTGVNLAGADLQDANLEGADLRGARLEQATLEGADVRGANLREASFDESTTLPSDAYKVVKNSSGKQILVGPSICLRGADLQGTDLRGADLEGVDLREAGLMLANLKSANLRYTTLDRAKLAGADLQGANLHGANLQYANLQGANLMYAGLSNAHLPGVNLNKANLRYATFHHSRLREADLEGADLRDSVLYNARLQSAKLQSANLQGADLTMANLEGALNLSEVIGIPASLPEGYMLVEGTKYNAIVKV